MKYGSALLFLLGLTVTGIALASQPPFGIIERELAEIRAKGGGETPQKVREAVLLFWLAHYTDDATKKKETLDRAMAFLDKERVDQPLNPEVLFAWIAVQGELLQLKNPFAALGGIRPLEAEVLRLRALRPQYNFHAADRILGRLYQQAPSFISIGSSSKARDHFLSALRDSPGYPANKVYYADFLLSRGEKGNARKLALEVLESPELDRYPLERLDWTRMAKSILQNTREAED